MFTCENPKIIVPENLIQYFAFFKKDVVVVAFEHNYYIPNVKKSAVNIAHCVVRAFEVGYRRWSVTYPNENTAMENHIVQASYFDKRITNFSGDFVKLEIAVQAV